MPYIRSTTIRISCLRWLSGVLFVFLFAGISSPSALAAPPSGRLDPSFGTGGKVLTDFSGSESNDVDFALAIQGDGKLVTAGLSNGDFALARYDTDGSLDSSFNTTGTVLTDFSGSGSFDVAFGVAIQDDGRIVAAGFSSADGSFDFALARYNSDGTLDTSFNTTGTVLTDFSGSGSDDEARAVAIQSDGKIVVAGGSGPAVPDDFAVARYNPDGSLDTSFGSTGLVTTDFSGSGSSDEAWALAIQSDGMIVTAGNSFAGGIATDFALARYNSNGSLDTSFNSTGTVLTDFNCSGGLYDQANAVTIQSDGKIVAGGGCVAGVGADFALARYNSNGSLDTSFGSTGLVTTDFSGTGSDDAVRALAIDVKGKIVAAGPSNASGSYDFALARYKINGKLDASFNMTGTVTTDFSGTGSDDAASALAIDGNGKLVVAGSSGPFEASGINDFALTRYRA